jgi:hypothetical protein
MRPIRVDLSEYREYDKFAKMIGDLFGLEDKERIKAFYDDMFGRYLQIILDLNSGEIMQAYTTEGYWIMTKYFIDLTPTPQDIYNGTKTSFDPIPNNNATGFEPSKLKQKQLNEAKMLVNAILKKIEEEGEESLTGLELKYLKDNSHLL